MLGEKVLAALRTLILVYGALPFSRIELLCRQ